MTINILPFIAELIKMVILATPTVFEVVSLCVDLIFILTKLGLLMTINYIHSIQNRNLDFLHFKCKYSVWFVLGITESVSEWKDTYKI